MKINKKAAIEMSMTTIIVIIIGVVILSLGLVFVQKIFGKAKILTEDTFAKAEGAIADFGQIKSPLTTTISRIDLEKGKDHIISVILANFEDKTVTASVAVSVPKQFEKDISCTFVDTESQKSDSYTLPSGEFRSIDLRVSSKEEGTLGSKSCKIVAIGLGESIQDTISIKVVA